LIGIKHDNGVEIIQHTALKEPKRLVLNGIALAPKSEDEPPTRKNEAIVLLDEELATKGECEAGATSSRSTTGRSSAS